MNARQAFEAHDGRLIDKWAHYFPIYERHFAKFVGQDVRVLEIGVGHGGSLQLWKRYFGKYARIYGLDIDPRCKEYEEQNIAIEICNQINPPNFFPPLDIVIDDGSHLSQDQTASFAALWAQVNPGGVYLIEDCHRGYPLLSPMPDLIYYYPWIVVCEKPQRVVRGEPSRPLNAAEMQAYGARYRKTVVVDELT